MLSQMYYRTGFALFAVIAHCCLVFNLASTITQGHHHQHFLQTWATRLILSKPCFESLNVSFGVSTGVGLLKSKLEQCRQLWQKECWIIVCFRERIIGCSFDVIAKNEDKSKWYGKYRCIVFLYSLLGVLKRPTLAKISWDMVMEDKTSLLLGHCFHTTGNTFLS